MTTTKQGTEQSAYGQHDHEWFVRLFDHKISGSPTGKAKKVQSLFPATRAEKKIQMRNNED